MEQQQQGKAPAPRRWSRGLVAAIALVAAVALVTAGVFVGRRFVPTDGVKALVSPTPTTDASPTPSVPPGFTSFVDDRTGIRLAYPDDWRTLSSADPQVRFIATSNGKDSVLVRVLKPRFTVTADNLAEARVLTDGIVRSSRGVQMLTEPEQIELAGLPGYYYLYTFEDERSGEKGAHSHYFLFDGDTMVTLVFQALPAQRFVRLAPTFDEIASSFTMTPQV